MRLAVMTGLIYIKIQLCKQTTTILRITSYLNKLYLSISRYNFESKLKSQRSPSILQSYKNLSKQTNICAYFYWLKIICESHELKKYESPTPFRFRHLHFYMTNTNCNEILTTSHHNWYFSYSTIFKKSPQNAASTKSLYLYRLDDPDA